MTKFDPKEVGGLVKRLRAAEASERIYGFDHTADLIAEADDAIEALAGELAEKKRLIEIALRETAPARDEANKRAERAEAALAETRRERDELSDYSFEATKAITGLTVGGSEFFGRKLCDGRYSADLPFCVAHIQRRDQQQHETLLRESHRRQAVTAQRDEALKALNLIDALDPEEHVYGCSGDALRGIVIQMGQIARRVCEGGKEDG